MYRIKNYNNKHELRANITLEDEHTYIYINKCIPLFKLNV